MQGGLRRLTAGLAAVVRARLEGGPSWCGYCRAAAWRLAALGGPRPDLEAPDLVGGDNYRSVAAAGGPVVWGWPRGAFP